MLGRIRRVPDRGVPEDEQSIQGVGSLLGDGVKSLLDGESVVLPGDSDDMSSVNTNTLADQQDVFRIVSHDPDHDPDDSTMMGGVEDQHNGRQGEDENHHGAVAGGCLPLWLTGAPKWLKMAIVVFTALFVGAVVLVGVAAVIDRSQNENGDPSRSNGDELVGTPASSAGPSTFPSAFSSMTPSGSPWPSLQPSNAPTTSFPTASMTPTGRPRPSLQPSNAPTTRFPTAAPSLSPSMAPSPSPSMAPSPTPSMAPSPSPSMTPSMTPSPRPTVFYLTAGRPLGDELSDFEDNLPNLPKDADFMVHLGDWNSPFSTECDEDSYRVVDELFRTSSVPVYFIPGDNEYNDCPNIDQAFGFWKETLIGYETKYWPSPPWTIERYSGVHPENFAFVLRTILYIGINLVGGAVHDADEWAARQAADLAWIDSQFEKHRLDIEVMIVLAHSDPDVSTNDPFFVPFFDRIRNEYNMPTILIHRNLFSETSGSDANYDGITNFAVLVAEGNTWPPMRVELHTTTGQSWSVLWDQDDWFDSV